MRKRAAASVVLALALLGACKGDSSKTSHDAASTRTTKATRATTSTTETVGGHGTPTTNKNSPASDDEYADQGDYVNGRHAALITSVDHNNRAITVDVVQFLTGDAAKKAYSEDLHTNEPPDDDYYVRNQSKQLRTFPVPTDASIRVNVLGGYDPSEPEKGHQVDWDTFTGYFSGETEGTAKAAPFWITLVDGKAVDVFEQYVP